MVVLDTSGLIYWTLDPGHLTPAAARAIDSANRILISAISIWEIGIKVKKGRLEIPLELKDYVKRLKTVDKIEIVAVDENMWIANLELDWSHRDPADRTIVATAQWFACPLVTSDAMILAYYPQAIW